MARFRFAVKEVRVDYELMNLLPHHPELLDHIGTQQRPYRAPKCIVVVESTGPIDCALDTAISLAARATEKQAVSTELLALFATLSNHQ
jgi:hypothetical protein